MISIVTARKRSLGQGNVFTPVCHSVHGGCILPTPVQTAPGQAPFHSQTPPSGQTPPGRHNPRQNPP